MRALQLKSCYFHHKSAILKTILLLGLSWFCLVNLIAQKESNIKLKIEAGFLWDWVDGSIYLSGPFLSVEPKLKTSANTVIGLRLGAAQNTQRIINADPFQYSIDNVFDNGNSNGIFSFIPTIDFTFDDRKFRPYLGAGVGYNFLTTSKNVFVRGTIDAVETSVNNKVGGLLRGGLYIRQFTVGLEFNYIPKTEIELSNGQVIGTMNNSNIALAVGYTIGNRM